MSAHENSVPAPGLAVPGPEQSAAAAAPASSNALAATPLEPMSAFFAARVFGYDAHMLEDVQGCREGYARMAELVDMHAKSVSASPLRLLDLGCGTGLELDEIFRRLPDAEATGVDLAPAMLGRLREKHAGKRIRLICGSYFNVDFGWQAFDCAVSFAIIWWISSRRRTTILRKTHACARNRAFPQTRFTTLTRPARLQTRYRFCKMRVLLRSNRCSAWAIPPCCPPSVRFRRNAFR